MGGDIGKSSTGPSRLEAITRMVGGPSRLEAITSMVGGHHLVGPTVL